MPTCHPVSIAGVRGGKHGRESRRPPWTHRHHRQTRVVGVHVQRARPRIAVVEDEQPPRPGVDLHPQVDEPCAAALLHLAEVGQRRDEPVAAAGRRPPAPLVQGVVGVPVLAVLLAVGVVDDLDVLGVLGRDSDEVRYPLHDLPHHGRAVVWQPRRVIRAPTALPAPPAVVGGDARPGHFRLREGDHRLEPRCFNILILSYFKFAKIIQMYVIT